MADKMIFVKSEAMDIEWLEMRETIDAVEDAIKQQVIRQDKINGESIHIILAGSIGLWDGTRQGGKHVKLGDVLESSNYDDLEVYLNDNNELVFKFMHHDGSHYMNLYALSEEQLEGTGMNSDDEETWDGQDYINVIERFEPVKADDQFNPGWELYER